MKITIKFEDTISIQKSLDLDELSTSLNINNISIEKKQLPAEKGGKAIGPTQALEIIAQGFTVLGAIASSISAWGDRKSYSVTVKNKRFEYTITGLTTKEFEGIIKKLRKHEKQQEIEDLEYKIRKV